MFQIIRAELKDAPILSTIGASTFVSSHKDSTTPENIAEYIQKKYNLETVQAELQDAQNLYYLLYVDGQIAGYSKIVFDVPNPNIVEQKVTKLDRLYLLDNFQGQGLGMELFQFNVQLAKEAGQVGMWLFVWTGNIKARSFYEKLGFVLVGNRAFPITATHSNPNYELYLRF